MVNLLSWYIENRFNLSLNIFYQVEACFCDWDVPLLSCAHKHTSSFERRLPSASTKNAARFRYKWTSDPERPNGQTGFRLRLYWISVDLARKGCKFRANAALRRSLFPPWLVWIWLVYCRPNHISFLRGNARVRPREKERTRQKKTCAISPAEMGERALQGNLLRFGSCCIIVVKTHADSKWRIFTAACKKKRSNLFWKQERIFLMNFVNLIFFHENLFVINNKTLLKDYLIFTHFVKL